MVDYEVIRHVTPMKNIFKTASFVSKTNLKKLRLLVVATFFVSTCTLILVFLKPPLVFDEDAKQAAAHMLQCMEEIKKFREELGIPIETAYDPAQSGIIGVDYSDLTTSLGTLQAKQTSLNPQFAALIVMLIKKAGVRAGDTIAVSFSGSFPALNMGVLSACEVLQLSPMIISSLGASTYGANIPGFTWLEMETRLYTKGLIKHRSAYASLGGIMDTGGGIDETGIILAEASIAKHGAVYLPEGTPRTIIPDVTRRMKLYTESITPSIFINVGGNVTSLGWVAEAARLNNGLLRSIPSSQSEQRGTVFRMFEKRIPVIHLLNIERLAATYNISIAPRVLTLQWDVHKIWYHKNILLTLVLTAWLLLSAILIFPCDIMKNKLDI